MVLGDLLGSSFDGVGKLRGPLVPTRKEVVGSQVRARLRPPHLFICELPKLQSVVIMAARYQPAYLRDQDRSECRMPFIVGTPAGVAQRAALVEDKACSLRELLPIHAHFPNILHLRYLQDVELLVCLRDIDKMMLEDPLQHFRR